MKLNTTAVKNSFLLLICAFVLSACGGGDGGGAPVAISASQANTALTLAKSSNTTFATHLLNISDNADALSVFSAPNVVAGPNPSATQAIACAVSGSYAYIYLKSVYKTGLSAGDYYSVTYSACKNVSNGPVLRGSVAVVASTSTNLNVSSATAYSLPISVILNNYSETTSTLTSTLNGTIDYTTLSFAPSNDRIVASSASLSITSTTSAGTLTANHSNAAMSFTAPGTTATAYYLSATSPTAAPVEMNVSASVLGNLSSPTSAIFTITQYFGARITGNLPSGLTSVDYGSDGVIDLQFSQAF